LPVYKAKAKASHSYVALLTEKPDQTRFTIIEVELIGKSQWCCSAKWGRPLRVLTNNWTRSNQSANTPPQSTTTGMVAVKNFLTPTSQSHFQNNGATNTSADPVSNSMLLKLKKGGRKKKEIGKGQRRVFIKTNDGPHRGI